MPYCQSAPHNAELNGLFQCQFQGDNPTAFVGSNGTIPFGMSAPVSPAGSCPANPSGLIADGSQLVDLTQNPGVGGTTASNDTTSGEDPSDSLPTTSLAMAASSPAATSATLHLISFYHSCTSADAGRTLSTWFFYLAAMLYDIVMVTTSTIHLLHYNPLSSRVERLVRVLIYDGIGYFIVLTASNSIADAQWKLSDFVGLFLLLVIIVASVAGFFVTSCSSHQALLESLMPMPTFSRPTPYILNFASAAKVTSNPPPHPPEAPTGFNPMLLNSMSPDGGFPAPSISHLLNGAGSSTVPCTRFITTFDTPGITPFPSFSSSPWPYPITYVLLHFLASSGSLVAILQHTLDPNHAIQQSQAPRIAYPMIRAIRHSIADEPKGDENGSDSTSAREMAICIQPGDEDETTGKDLYLVRLLLTSRYPRLKQSFLNTPFTHFFTRPSRPALSTPSTASPHPRL
ncbi:hypothetical protein F4604DRAFT_1939553 [Suillus subluteus]|nr:hypothetical protein F4604DRAFT_1939553 [Suillus subluteus]